MSHYKCHNDNEINDVKIKSEYGFTLVEVVLSLTLLVVVIGVMLPIFPQIVGWSNETERYMSSHYVIGQIADDLQRNAGDIPLSDLSGEDTLTLDDGAVSELLGYTVEYDYEIVVKVQKEENVDLYRANIRTLADNGEVMSESYTYLKEGGV